ncbi:MAG: glycosyltransferase family 2 protein [Calditrichia bacterium]
MPLVSLVVVNWNGRHYLEKLFESLRKVTYPAVEIILVDNASQDDSVAFTRENYPEIKVVQLDKNYMFARGNNEGVKAAKGEIIGLVNNDVVVDPGFIEPVVEAFQKYPEAAACQSKILDLNNPTKFEYAGAAGGYIDRFGYPFLRGRLFFTVEEDAGQYDTETALFWSSGACMFIRKSVWQQTGGMDEDFTLHMEEIDLCWRIRLLGYQIRFVPQSRVWHKGGGTMSAEDPRKVFWNYRNNIFLLVKNLSGVNLAKILLIRLFMDILATAGELARGKPAGAFSIIRAYGWVISHIKLMVRKRRAVQNIRKVSDSFIYQLIYPGSIVWEYFILKRKLFGELKYHHRLIEE